MMFAFNQLTKSTNEYRFSVGRVDNRYANQKLPRTARTNVFINVQFEVHGQPHTAEVQLMLQDFLLTTELEHKFFEIKRVEDFRGLLLPVFRADHWAFRLSKTE